MRAPAGWSGARWVRQRRAGVRPPRPSGLARDRCRGLPRPSWLGPDRARAHELRPPTWSSPRVVGARGSGGRAWPVDGGLGRGPTDRRGDPWPASRGAGRSICRGRRTRRRLANHAGPATSFGIDQSLEFTPVQEHAAAVLALLHEDSTSLEGTHPAAALRADEVPSRRHATTPSSGASGASRRRRRTGIAHGPCGRGSPAPTAGNGLPRSYTRGRPGRRLVRATSCRVPREASLASAYQPGHSQRRATAKGHVGLVRRTAASEPRSTPPRRRMPKVSSARKAGPVPPGAPGARRVVDRTAGDYSPS